MVRALGLEPSLVRGKSPVPYLLGVTRMVRNRCGDRSLDDASAVVNVLVSRLAVGRVEAGSEGVEPPAVGFGDRGATLARARKGMDAHDGVRVLCEEALANPVRRAAR